jgi:hypothetical protein
MWDPRGPVPELGENDTAVVTVLDLDSLQRAFQWLSAGKHPFRSVILDSLTEVQKRTINAVAGQNIPQGKDWQAVLNKLDNLVRAFRDLTLNPIKPVEIVIFICGSKEYGTAEHAVIRPMLQGQMANLLPYSVDVMAYMEVGVGADGGLERRALFANVQGVAAKDRTGKLGVNMDAPSIPRILDLAYSGPKEETA